MKIQSMAALSSTSTSTAIASAETDSKKTKKVLSTSQSSEEKVPLLAEGEAEKNGMRSSLRFNAIRSLL